jgi:hypothetical protein
MGAFSKGLGGCLSLVGSLVTNKRRRLRFVVVLTAVRNSHALQHVLTLCAPPRAESTDFVLLKTGYARPAPPPHPQVLEITTAVLAAQEATKLQALVDLKESKGAAPTDPEVMAYTLLVCNCAAQVVFVTMHILYSFVRASLRGCGGTRAPRLVADAPLHVCSAWRQYFTFMRSCCGWCRSSSMSTMFGMLTTMTFYTSILSLALAGPLQSALPSQTALPSAVAPRSDVAPVPLLAHTSVYDKDVVRAAPCCTALAGMRAVVQRSSLHLAPPPTPMPRAEKLLRRHHHHLRLHLVQSDRLPAVCHHLRAVLRLRLLSGALFFILRVPLRHACLYLPQLTPCHPPVPPLGCPPSLSLHPGERG